MSDFERLELVVMISDAESDLMPWPVDESVPQWQYLRMNGDLSLPQVGLIMRELMLEAGVNEADDPVTMLRELLNTELSRLSLPGGVRVVADDTVIDPSDGSGLEDWRDWLSYQADVFDVWMGEEPAPFVERLDNGDVLVWSEWTSDPDDPDVYHITIPAAAVMPAVHQLDADLRSFRDLIEAWAHDVTGNASIAQAVREQFDEAF